MLFKTRSHYPYFFLLILLAFFYSCANIVPPTGGPIDTTPPKLLNIHPADSQLNQKVTQIVMNFDKNMEVNDLATHFNMSPLLPQPPEVIANLKKIIVHIPDSLLHESTTYFLDFGSSITDNREKTAAEHLTYTFSTGNYFDSLSIQGQVIAAETGMGDSMATVVLFPMPYSDSSIVKDLPKYGIRTDEQGFFEFKSLPKGPYALLAIRETSINYKWDPTSEGIGFITTEIEAYTGDDLEHLQIIYTAPAPSDTLLTEQEQDHSSGIRGNRQRNAASSAPYQVLVDTTQSKLQEINQSLKIVIADSLFKIEEDRIFLSYEREGTEIEALYEWNKQGDTLHLITEWRENSLYTLRLMKGWALKEEEELNPGKFEFITKAQKDYANLKIIFEEALVDADYHAIIIQDNDTIFHENITTENISLTMLSPSPINVLMFLDQNKNGQWDTGDYWLQVAPETIHPVLTNRPLRAGWDNEFTVSKWESPITAIKQHFERKTTQGGGLSKKSDQSKDTEEVEKEE